jgi:hypothetical protein
MEYLDLSCHDPEEYEGKHLVLNGCEYKVGEHLGTGGERIAHKLINLPSCIKNCSTRESSDRPVHGGHRQAPCVS